MVGAIQFLAIVSRLAPIWYPRSRTTIQRSMATLLERSMAAEIGAGEWPDLLRGLFIHTLLPIVTSGAVVLVVTTGTHLAITKMGFSLERLTPKFERFNPMAKLRELPQQNLKSVIEAALLLAVLFVAIYSFFRSYAELLMRLPFESVQRAPRRLAVRSKTCCGKQRLSSSSSAPSICSVNTGSICPHCA